MEAESIKKMCQVFWPGAAPPVVQQGATQAQTVVTPDSSSSPSPEISIRQKEGDQ